MLNELEKKYICGWEKKKKKKGQRYRGVSRNENQEREREGRKKRPPEERADRQTDRRG